MLTLWNRRLPPTKDLQIHPWYRPRTATFQIKENIKNQPSSHRGIQETDRNNTLNKFIQTAILNK